MNLKQHEAMHTGLKEGTEPSWWSCVGRPDEKSEAKARPHLNGCERRPRFFGKSRSMDEP